MDAVTFLAWALLFLLVLYVGGRCVLGNWFRKLRRNLLSTFLMEYLGTLAKLGLPLTQALGSCSRMLSRSSRRDLADVEQNLKEGMLLGDALARVPRWGRTLRDCLRQWFLTFQPYPPARLVSPAEAETLRIGEMTGNLGSAFQLVIQERRRFEELRASLTAAFLYPVAVLLIAGTILTGIMTFIVPKFKKMFEEMSVELPHTTKLLIAGGNEFMWLWPLMILLLPVLAATCALVVWRIRRLRALTRGAWPVLELLQRAVHFIPFHLGAMRRALLAEFCTELAMLLRIGAPAHRALRVLADGTMNPWFRDRVRRAAEVCEKGERLSAALEQSGLDRRAAWFCRATGEPTELADSLAGLAEDYRARTSWVAGVGGRLLPPILILCLGAVVAFVVISLFLPLVKLANSLGG